MAPLHLQSDVFQLLQIFIAIITDRVADLPGVTVVAKVIAENSTEIRPEDRPSWALQQEIFLEWNEGNEEFKKMVGAGILHFFY